MNRSIKTYIDNDKLIIEVPIDLLVFAFENHPELAGVYSINDKKKFAKSAADYFLDGGGDSETGSTAFTDLLDGMFNMMIEDAEEFIDEI